MPMPITHNLLERSIRIAPFGLAGDLVIPDQATSIVVFAHGSGSSRHSTRNRYVAAMLQDAGLATLLMDLLTEKEEVADRHTGHLRFDLPLLADRLTYATDWLAADRATRRLALGYFGASTGAGAALMAAAARPDRVSAVVSRGGRPDLAQAALPEVKAPTLMIVGSEDEAVLDLNRWALGQMRVDRRMEIVEGATHLFEEPGALEEVAFLAQRWFLKYLVYPQG